MGRFVAAAVVVACWACEPSGEPPAPAAPEPTVEASAVPIVDNREPTSATPWTVDAAPLFRIGDTPGQPGEELFQATGALLLSDGRLVIANTGTNEIRYYGPTGEFIRSVGRTGDGPGEFRTLLNLIALTADSIAVGDFRLSRLSIFDGAGDFARSVSYREAFTAAPVHQVFAGAYLFATQAFASTGEDTGPPRAERYWMDVALFDEATTRMDTIASLPWVEMVIGPTGVRREDGSPIIGPRPRSFGTTTWLAVLGGGWVVADNARAELEIRDRRGNVTRIVRWPAERRPVTATDAEVGLQWRLGRAPNDAQRQRLAESFAAAPPPPDSMPAFGCDYNACTALPLLVDPLRHVWLREYAPPWETGPDRFLVFDESGTWLGRVTMPPDVHPMWIGTDRMVGEHTTELGVEVVSVHRLVRGSR